MKKVKKAELLLAICVCLALLTGCASTTQFVELPDQSKRIEDPSKARIYVVRPTGFGAAISMMVSDGNKVIGETGPNGFLCWEREPGQTEVVGKAENTSRLPINTESGNVYYVQQHIQLGLIKARNKLTLMTEEKGKASVNKCKPPKLRK